jgi:dienelactone hydrolase
VRGNLRGVRPAPLSVLIAFAVLGCDSSAGTRREEAPDPRSPAIGPHEPSPALPASSAPSPVASPAPSAKPVRKLLKASSPFVHLTLIGLPPAVVSLPIGADSPRPIVIATHGNYDRPEWQCEVWREIVGDDAFILCPRGIARPDSPAPDDIRFTYSNNQALEKEVVAGLAALRAQYPDHATGGAVLYTGFSLGAIMGIAIATRAPSTFPRLVLVEGGHDRWTPDAVKAFAQGGGQRVLFVCSQPGCTAAAKVAAARLTKAGVAANVVGGPDAGHRYDGPIMERTIKALPWVLEGDERWP